MAKGNKCGNINLNDPTSIFFWGLIIILFVLVIGNFILTISIISFFKIGTGMPIQLIPEWKTIKFHGTVDFLKVFKKDGHLESFKDAPAVIESDESSLKFNLIDRKGQVHNRFMMTNGGIDLRGLNMFVIRDPITNQPVFTTSSKLIYHLEKSTKNLESATYINAREIVSPIDSDLKIESKNTNMYVRGIEGIKIEGRKIHASAKQHIFFKSSNGSIVLGAQNQTKLAVERMPMSTAQGDMQYKLCVCLPKGTLYRVPLYNQHHQLDVKDPCRHINRTVYDPCV